MSAPKITSHQADILGDLVRRALRSSRTDVLHATTYDLKPVPENEIGSSGALRHLRDKGYARIADEVQGPRGGTRFYWMPTALGLHTVQRYIKRMINQKETAS